MQAVPKAVLFDFNGVLVDDESLHQEAFSAALALEGWTLTPEDYLTRYFGVEDRELFERFFQDQGIQLAPDEIIDWVERKGRIYEGFLERVVLIPGAPEALRDFAAHVPVAIVSGALRSEIEALLKRFSLEKLVTVIVAAGEIPRGKPAPDAYQKAVALLGIEPWEGLVLEDAPAGIQAARQAGLTCWALSTSHPAEHLGSAHKILSTLVGVRFEHLGLSELSARL